MAKPAPKKKMHNKTYFFISASASLLIVIITIVYAYGVHQGRASSADASRSSIIEAFDVAKEETKVSNVLTDVEEQIKVDEILKQAEADAASKAVPVETAPKQTTKTETKKTTPESTKKVMKGISFSNALVSVEAESVVFSVNLPENLVGDCKVFLQKVGDKAGAWHYNKSASPRSTCVTSIPRSQLSTGVWNYELTFMSESVYGTNNPKGSFTLE